MADIRTRIDELIEESYLATLPEEEIREDLLTFVDTCARLFREANGENEEIMSELEQFRTLALRIEEASELADEQEEWSAWSAHDLLAHRAARLKLLLLETIREHDSDLADRIERERFPAGEPKPQEQVVSQLPSRAIRQQKSARLSPEVSDTLLRASYALLVGLIAFIIGYRLIF